MRLRDLKQKISGSVFWTGLVEKLFRDEDQNQINIQLSRWKKKGEIVRLKRGIYKFADREIDELAVASLLYKPSYISLETALHLQGIIPGIPSQVTSLTTITSKKFKNKLGIFSYSKIKKDLYFGFLTVKDNQAQIHYQMAEPEKALLDWVYIRKIKSLTDSRVDTTKIDFKKLRFWIKKYPDWVRKAVESYE